MENFTNKFELAKKSLNNVRGIFDKNKSKIKLNELEKTLIQENFWKNKSLVKKTIKQKKIYEDILNSYNNSFSELNNLNDLFNLASQEKDKDTIEDCILKINEIFEIIKKNEINCFLSGENDDLNVYIEIHAGATRRYGKSGLGRYA